MFLILTVLADWHTLTRAYTEYPKNRLEQRPPRSSYLRLHNRNHHLLAPEHRRFHPRHEHIRRA